MHITLHLGLFHCIPHSLFFHITTLTCCITSPSLITWTITPLITNTTALTNTRSLPATLSSLYDILTLTKQTSPSHPTSCILPCRSLTIQMLDSTSKQQTCKLQHPLTSFHSTSQSPHLHFTIASNQLHLCFTENASSKIHDTHPT